LCPVKTGNLNLRWHAQVSEQFTKITMLTLRQISDMIIYSVLLNVAAEQNLAIVSDRCGKPCSGRGITFAKDCPGCCMENPKDLHLALDRQAVGEIAQRLSDLR
jgi:hypothetical protein